MKKFLFFLSFALFSLCACMVACTESPSVTECEVIDVKQPLFLTSIMASLMSNLPNSHGINNPKVYKYGYVMCDGLESICTYSVNPDQRKNLNVEL